MRATSFGHDLFQMKHFAKIYVQSKDCQQGVQLQFIDNRIHQLMLC